MGLIRPPIEQGGGDLLLYQKKIDESLTTTDKTIVGSINEANKQLIQIEGKDNEQDSRLKNVEYKNKVQQVYLDGLFGNSADDVLSIEGEGDNLKLEGSKVGYVEVEKLVGNTLVNLSNQKDKVTITKKYGDIVGNEGKLVVGDVANKKGHVKVDKIVGNTLVNIVTTYDIGNFDLLNATKQDDNYFKLQYGSNVNSSYVIPRFGTHLYKPNTTYTVIVEIKENTTGQLLGMSPINSVLNDVADRNFENPLGISTMLITTKSDFNSVTNKWYDFYFGIWKEGVGDLTNHITFRYWVLEGDYTNKPIPQDLIEGLQSSFEENLVTQEMVEQGLESAENLGKYKVPIRIVGKNKFNANVAEIGCTDWGGGGSDLDNFNNTFARVPMSNLIKVKPNTSYVFNMPNWCVVSYFDKNKNFISGMADETAVNITTPSNAYYLRFRNYHAYSDGSALEKIKEVQLEEGTVSTDFEEYFERTANAYLNSPLLKNDEIVMHNGELCHYHKMWIMNVLDSTTSSTVWVYDGLIGEQHAFWSNTLKNYGKSYITISDNIISDKLHSIFQGNAINISFNEGELVSNDDVGVKDWITKNNPKVVYQLAEPYYEVIDAKDLTLECANNSTIHIDTVVPIENISFKTHEEELRYLYNSKTYKVKFTSDAVGNCDITLGGTQSLNQSVKVGINEFYITTPSTLTDNKLIISGEGFSIEEVSVVDTVLDYDYFEGISSCFENQLVTEQMVTEGLEDSKNLGKYKIPIKIIGKNKFTRDLEFIDTQTTYMWYAVDRLNFKQDAWYTSTIQSGTDEYVVLSEYPWYTNTCLPIVANGSASSFKYSNIYKYIGFNKNGTPSPISDSELLQIEEGTVATTYEPYFEHIENIYLNSPLLKEGELVWEDGELRYYHRYGKVILDHNKEWIDNNNNSTGCYALSLANKPSIDCKTDSNLIISDVLKWRNGDIWDSFGDNEISVTSDNGTIYIFTKIVTLEEFKTWLQSNPITIVYKLAEPYYEVIQTSKLMPKCSNDSTLHIDTIIPIKNIKVSYTGNVVSMNTIRATKETTDYNSLDINDLIIPYCLDLDAQISEINVSLEAITPQTQSLKIKSIFGGIDMTYQVLKREIIRGVMTYEDCIDKIAIFKLDNKLTEAQAEELTEIAEIYLK